MEGSNLRVLQGGRDPGFARAHRGEIEGRLTARGLTAHQAAQAFERGLAALEDERLYQPKGGIHGKTNDEG